MRRSLILRRLLGEEEGVDEATTLLDEQLEEPEDEVGEGAHLPQGTDS